MRIEVNIQKGHIFLVFVLILIGFVAVILLNPVLGLFDYDNNLLLIGIYTTATILYLFFTYQMLHTMQLSFFEQKRPYALFSLFPSQKGYQSGAITAVRKGKEIHLCCKSVNNFARKLTIAVFVIVRGNEIPVGTWVITDLEAGPSGYCDELIDRKLVSITGEKKFTVILRGTVTSELGQTYSLEPRKLEIEKVFEPDGTTFKEFKISALSTDYWEDAQIPNEGDEA